MAVRRAHPGWREGWWRLARLCPSPNYGPRPGDDVPSLVVLHSISLPPGVFRGRAVERLFGNTLDCNRHRDFVPLRDLKVSAHFLVRRAGELVQFVSCEQRAWHAGLSNWRGRSHCNDWSIGIELEGLEGRTFSAAQYRALSRLLRAIVEHYPIVEIVGHEHVAPGRKRDPGPGFDWTRLRRRLHASRARIWPVSDGSD
jgi:N-acetyl-anhydromuramoyl-L-alanine amidase